MDIHEAALRLARDHDFDKITVDMISVEAGVSRRTFSNYFPNKEEAVLDGPTALTPEIVEEFVALGPASPHQVLVDLTATMVRDLAVQAPQRQSMHAAFELAHAHFSVMAAMLARFDRLQRSVADAVAQRLGQNPNDDVPRLVAAVALTVMRVGLERWSADDSANRHDSPVPYVERSAALLQALFTP